MDNRKNIVDMLAELWQAVLELDETPTEDADFFELGGNSYKAFFVITNLPEEYEGKLEMNDFFEYETLGKMADRLIENVNTPIEE